MPDFKAVGVLCETGETVDIEYRGDDNVLIVGDYATAITRGTRVFFDKQKKGNPIMRFFSSKPKGDYSDYKHIDNVRVAIPKKEGLILLKSMDLGKSDTAEFYYLMWNESHKGPLKMKPFDC